jgi:hypothetical protein
MDTCGTFPGTPFTDDNEVWLSYPRQHWQKTGRQSETTAVIAPDHEFKSTQWQRTQEDGSEAFFELEKSLLAVTFTHD